MRIHFEDETYYLSAYLIIIYALNFGLRTCTVLESLLAAEFAGKCKSICKFINLALDV